MVFFSKYDCEVVRVFQIREHHAKIVKLGRYEVDSGPCCLRSGDLPSPLMAIFTFEIVMAR